MRAYEGLTYMSWCPSQIHSPCACVLLNLAHESTAQILQAVAPIYYDITLAVFGKVYAILYKHFVCRRNDGERHTKIFAVVSFIVRVGNHCDSLRSFPSGRVS